MATQALRAWSCEGFSWRSVALDRKGSALTLTEDLRRVLDWLRAGYPDGVPALDYMPVLALLHRHLTEDEVRQVVAELELTSAKATDAEVGLRIMKITDAVADPQDIERVEERLNSLQQSRSAGLNGVH